MPQHASTRFDSQLRAPPPLCQLLPPQVYANDLNPASFEYLCTNIKLNRVGGKVLPFNMDGRAFMRQAAAGSLDLAAAAAIVPPPPAKPAKGGKTKKQQQQQADAEQAPQSQPQQQPQPPPQQQQQEAHAGAPESAAAAPAAADGNGSSSGSGLFQHIVMNLPAAAVEFLDALNGSFCPRLWEGQPLPLVHVYTFAKGEEELAGGCVAHAGRAAPAAAVVGTLTAGCCCVSGGCAASHAGIRWFIAPASEGVLRSVQAGQAGADLLAAYLHPLPFPPGLRQRVESHLGGPLDEEPQVRRHAGTAPAWRGFRCSSRMGQAHAYAELWHSSCFPSPAAAVASIPPPLAPWIAGAPGAGRGAQEAHGLRLVQGAAQPCLCQQRRRSRWRRQRWRR